MFGRKQQQTVVHTIELTDEAKQALVALENDLQVLTGFMREIVQQGRTILGTLNAQITEVVPTEAEKPFVPGDAASGVAVFSDERSYVERDEPSDVITNGPQTDKGDSDIDRERIRDSPFTRRPRHEQVAWLLNEVLADGEWHEAVEIAREWSTDARHARYLRGVANRLLRELWEESVLDRRASQVRGAMYEYRLKRR